MTLILVVGASDTGRAPLAAGLLRRMLADRGTTVEIGSAGVLDHTGDELQKEAQLALEHFGGVPGPHQARLLTAELAASARVLLAIDRGTGRVIAARHAELLERLLVLPELANDRDVPDPFHMSLDQWVFFGRMLQNQLQKALPVLLRQIEGGPADGDREQDHATQQVPTQSASGPAGLPQAGERPAPEARAVEQPTAQLRRVLVALEAAPEIIDWARCRQVLLEALTRIGAQAAPGDMAPAVVALLHGLLAQQAALPTPAQISWLVALAPLFEQPIDAMAMARVASEATRWSS